jgi:hypothetical protein
MNKKVLKLKDFPDHILYGQVTETKTKPANIEKAIEIIKNNGVIYTYNDINLMMSIITDRELFAAKDMLCVNYVDLFSKRFSDSSLEFPKSKFIYVYGIGEELANTYTFSDKVLSALVSINRNNKGSLILNSTKFGVTLFSENYPLTSKNIDKKVTI